jgi:predicted permease
VTALARLRSFLRALARPSHVDAEMDHELRFHVEARIEHLIAGGLSPADAAARARQEMGSLLQWKEQGRDARGTRFLDELRADFRYGVRQLCRSPVFTLAATASLALGIGANVAIFSLANTVLIKPLPIVRPAELVQVMHAGQRGPSGSSNYQWFRQIESRPDVFASVFGVRMSRFAVEADGTIDRVLGQQIVGDYYGTLGVQPALGRAVTAGEPGADRAVVISDDYWRRRFNRDPGVLGRTIAIDGTPFVVTGVMPEGFFGLQVGRMMDITTAIDVRDYDEANSWTSVPILGRLKPGMDQERAARALDPTLDRFARAQRMSEKARQASFAQVQLLPARNGLSALRDEFAEPLRILVAIVAILLVLACVNLAGLLIARNASRERELRTRLALGAGRARIARQLVTESALLALIGTGVGLAAGWLSSRALVGMLRNDGWPRTLPVGIDGTVLAFTAAMACLTVLLFGVWPAYRAARTDVGLMTREQRSSRVRSGIGRTLVAVQMALGVILIAGALLFLRTLLNLARVDAGFARTGVVAASIDFEDSPAVPDAAQFQRTLLERLRALPGMQQATLGSMTPLSGNENGRPVSVPGSKAAQGENRNMPPVLGDQSAVAQVNAVASQYFETFGIAIVEGRGIVDRDGPDTQKVVVVTQAFARLHYGDASPLGRRFRILGGRPGEYEIVGIARDARYRDLRRESPPMVYVSQFQLPEDEIDFAIRTSGDERQAAALLQQTVRALAPALPFLDVTSVSGRIGESIWRERLLAALCTFFALVAIVLATIGTYALLAHLVARRRFELGLRAALGASSPAIVWLIVRQGLALALGGGAVGVAIALVLLRGLEGLLFGLPPTDRLTLALAAGILLAVALLAAFIPARRAARIDPLIALRTE